MSRLFCVAVGLLVCLQTLGCASLPDEPQTLLDEQGETIATALWEGSFASDDKPFVHGKIVCQLPDPLPIGEHVPMTTWVQTPLLVLTTGKLRIERTFDCTFAWSEDDPELIHVTMSSMGAFGIDSQSVVFETTLHPNDTETKGQYASQHPEDSGWFHAVKQVNESEKQVEVMEANDGDRATPSARAAVRLQRHRRLHRMTQGR